RSVSILFAELEAAYRASTSRMKVLIAARYWSVSSRTGVCEHDLSSTFDAVHERGGDRVRAHVMAAADHERRHVDLVETVAHVPTPQRSRDSPLVGPLHRSVDRDGLVGAHMHELRAGLRSPIEMAIEVRLHRALVLGIVVGTGAFVTLE